MNAITTKISTFGSKKNFSGMYNFISEEHAAGGWTHRKYFVQTENCNFTIDVVSRSEIDGVKLSICHVLHLPTVQRFTEAQIRTKARDFVAYIKHSLR